MLLIKFIHYYYKIENRFIMLKKYRIFLVTDFKYLAN